MTTDEPRIVFRSAKDVSREAVENLVAAGLEAEQQDDKQRTLQEEQQSAGEAFGKFLSEALDAKGKNKLTAADLFGEQDQ